MAKRETRVRPSLAFTLMFFLKNPPQVPPFFKTEGSKGPPCPGVEGKLTLGLRFLHRLLMQSVNAIVPSQSFAVSLPSQIFNFSEIFFSSKVARKSIMAFRVLCPLWTAKQNTKSEAESGQSFSQ